MKSPSATTDRTTLLVVRRLLALVLLIAFVGTFVELLLLEHDESAAQVIPLVLLVIAVVLLAWTVFRPVSAALILFRALMVLLIAGGALGLVLHYRANLEFQRDLVPNGAFVELFWKVMAAKAPPALAPAVLAQLGCLGLIYAYRLPVAGDTETGGGEG
jgi:hypothetical protein